MSSTLVWVKMGSIRKEIAEMPENWFYRFAAEHPNDIRKLGEAKQSTMLFRVSAILEAVESGELKRP